MEVKRQVQKVVIETKMMLVERDRGRQQITEQSIMGSILKVEVEEGLIRVLLCEDQVLPAELQTKTVLDAFTVKRMDILSDTVYRN